MDDEERAAYERRILLVGKELDHRVKNTLAIVLALARQIAKASPDVPTFMRAFEDRVISYKHTHELLGITQFQGVDLRALFLAELDPYRASHRIAIAGPDVFLPPRIALTVAMCVHEMTTNAIKHGSLSIADGAVDIKWTATGTSLVIDWTETDGPDPGLPTRRGFGSQLIHTGLVMDLKGSFKLDFPASGLVGQVRIPLAAQD